MKKIIFLMYGIFVCNTMLGMEQSCCVRSKEEQHRLDFELWSVLNFESGQTRYDKVRELLAAGANPNANPECMLYAARDARLVELLLSYGADPSQETGIGAPILWVGTLDALKLLVRAGAGIHAVKPLANRETVLSRLFDWFRCESEPRASAAVWALLHGADPNVGPSEDYDGGGEGFAIHDALCCRSIAAVLALLQHNVRLDVHTVYLKQPLQFAEDLACRYNAGLQEEAQYALLKAASEHKLNPDQMYSVSELERMGISYDSAVIIEQAMREVYDTYVKCALDDIEYRHGKQSITEYVLNRQLGFAGRSRSCVVVSTESGDGQPAAKRRKK